MSMLHLLAHSAAACASLGPEAAWFGASPGTAGAAGACSHLAPVPHFLFSPRSPPDRAAGWAPPPTEPQQPAAGAAGGSDGESKKGGKNPKGLATGEPVRPKPPRAPRRALPKRTAPLTLEEVAGVQHLPLREAAAACGALPDAHRLAPLSLLRSAAHSSSAAAVATERAGYAVTRFKFHCRELGVLRWRYRKIKSLDALIESSKRDAAKQVPETVDRLAGATGRKD